MKNGNVEIRRLVLESLLLRAESLRDPTRAWEYLAAYDLIASGEVVVRAKMPIAEVERKMR